MPSQLEMFYIKDPSTLKKPWFLSTLQDKDPVSIPLEVTRIMHNYDIMAIQFLYKNHRKGLKGSILNEENGMNFPLQICAFLRAMSSSKEATKLVLVIIPDLVLPSWHYHLSNEGGLKPIIINDENYATDFLLRDEKLALLISFSSLKLLEHLLDFKFSSVIVDDFDKIANKIIFKRLRGAFNIGLTRRSFYMEPDQKLLWNMLNWSNPGCVGKLSDFYEIDNRNFENFRDNYRLWWLRLSWKFCESFKKPTDEELASYREKLKDWVEFHDLDDFLPKTSRKRTARKRKLSEIIKKNSDEPCIGDIISNSSENSSDTTIIGTPQYDVPIDKYVKLPSMDESPILSSIIENFERSPNPIIYRQQYPYCSSSSNYDPIFNFNLPTCTEKSMHEEASCSNITRYKSKSEEFVLNLIQNDTKIQTKSEEPISLNVEIEQVLEEADALLRN